MSHSEIIEAIEAAGATVVINGTNAKLVGDVPAVVVEAIRADREAFLDAWREYEWDRYCKCPSVKLPMRSQPPHWRAEVYRRVEGYVRRQGGEASRWVTLRASRYLEAGMDEAASTKSALSDVLHWQLGRHSDPEDLLKTFEVVAKR